MGRFWRISFCSRAPGPPSSASLSTRTMMPADFERASDGLGKTPRLADKHEPVPGNPSRLDPPALRGRVQAIGERGVRASSILPRFGSCFIQPMR